MRKNRSKTPSESMGGTRGELVPARKLRRRQPGEAERSSTSAEVLAILHPQN